MDALGARVTTNADNLAAHVGDNSNPHAVTKAQVGLGNVDNTSDADKPVSTAQQTALDTLGGRVTANAAAISENAQNLATHASNGDIHTTAAEKAAWDAKADAADIPGASDAAPAMDGTASAGVSADYSRGDHVHPTDTSRAAASALAAHIADKANPHEVTAAQVGLGNVDNTSDADKPISTAQAAVNAGNQAQLDAFLTPKTIGPTALAGFSDGVDGAILGKCVVNIEPTQSGSGDPSPTNVRPISGWTGAKVNVAGKNLFDINNPFFSAFSAGYMNAYKGYIENGRLYNGGRIGYTGGGSITIPVSPGKYTIQAVINGESVTAEARAVNLDGNIWTSYTNIYGAYDITGKYTYTVIVPEGYTHLYVAWASATQYGSWETDIQIERNETATEYEPYKGNIYDISFGEAGTVYGGTLDVGTGVLTVDTFYGHVDKISYYWSKQGDYIGFYTYLKPGSGAYSLNWPDPKGNILFCNEFPIRGESGQIGATFNSAYTYISFRILYSDLGISDTATESEIVSAANSWLVSHPLYVVYPIATPITYQLTPVQVRTLLGLNNIYADCGDVTVQYRGDVPNLYENVAVITEQKNKFYCPPLYQYDGEDLTVKFASEIAQYSDVCAWLKARLAAKDISSIFVKDFFRFTTSNNVTFTARVADINHDLGYGDTEVTKYHIDFICDELWPDNHVWNKVNYNNGLATEPSPWLCSDLYHFLNSLSGNVPNGTGADPATVAVDYTSTGVFDKFPAWLRNAIVERRSSEPARYSAGNLMTDDTSWEWKNIGKLWVPSEIEYYGFIAWGTRSGYSIGEDHMYPLMRDSKMRVKRMPNGSRSGLWLRRARSGDSTDAVYCSSTGRVYSYGCSISYISPPVCFRIMAN